MLTSWTALAGPRPVVAEYAVGYNGFSADGVLRVAPARAGRWVVSLRFGNALARLDQATVFDSADGRMRPLGNSRVIEMPLRRKVVVAHFDWRAGRVAWSGDAKAGRRGPVALQAGDVDPLLFQLAVADDNTRGRQPVYRVLENGRARRLVYRRLRSESIDVDGHGYLASKLFATEGSKRYVVWVVPGIAVPLRLLQSEVGGDTIDMRLKALR